MTAAVRPRRSVLYVPASNPRAVAKARTLGADVVVLDLEDAVAPDQKVLARAAAMEAVAVGFGRAEVVVRVNALASAWGEADLAACVAAGVDAVLAPKIIGPDDITRYAEHLGPGAALWVMIETCLAVSRVQPIADRARRSPLAMMVVGANDLALEMRARPGPDREGLLPILALTVAAARARGLGIIDAVCNDYSDVARLDAECRQGRALGFDGKSLIHPAQIASANAAFAPQPDEVARAEAIRAAFARPENVGRGAIGVGGVMVERLHLIEAERTLALAAAIR